MKRGLPIIEFAGTDFYVDVELDEFRQVANPINTISFDFLQSSDDLMMFLVFDMLTLNISKAEFVTGELPAHLKIIHIPSLVSIDPVGVARKIHLPDNFFTED